jgi:hypothetical protein
MHFMTVTEPVLEFEVGDQMPVDSEKEIRKLMTKFEALGNITRATWFEWREAAIATARPEFTPIDLVLKAWEVVGHDTAKAYFNVLDVSKDTYIKDIAQAIVNSSTMMGEDAKLVPGENEDDIYVQWDRFPWPEFARRYGAPMEEDVAGCDMWFQTVIKDINELFNTNVKLETLKAIPRGERVCLRRISIEKKKEGE